MQLSLPSVDLTAPDSSIVPRRERRVYVNRNLRLDQIEWVGFDMDYTLAIYDQAEMDRLSIQATVEKMVERGYPESLSAMELPIEYPVRGLLIDTKLGNVLKMDRYKYVKRAYHGMRELSNEERRALYHSRRVRPSSARYHWIDTLYGLSEVTLYAGAVTHLEALGPLDHEKLFFDIRDCIDRSHQDGSILRHIEAHPERFLVRDPHLPATLHKLRSAGKKLFLLTNSQAAYTRRIMRFLLDGALPEYESYAQYFDAMICAARKPSWFTRDKPFERIAPDGSLSFAGKLERGQLYTGGCLDELERLIGTGGDSILYVGDHIYGDVLRAKKHSGWRTAMIIQELEQELTALSETGEAHDRWDRLEQAQQSMQDELRMRQTVLKDLSRREPQEADDEATRLRLRRSIERLRARLRAVEAECADVETEIERHFHPYWGPLLKAGAESSNFGYQVATYACLYTGRVSNFLHYSTLHYFRGPRDRLPHER